MRFQKGLFSKSPFCGFQGKALTNCASLRKRGSVFFLLGRVTHPPICMAGQNHLKRRSFRPAAPHPWLPRLFIVSLNPYRKALRESRGTFFQKAATPQDNMDLRKYLSLSLWERWRRLATERAVPRGRGAHGAGQHRFGSKTPDCLMPTKKAELKSSALYYVCVLRYSQTILICA